MHIGIVRNSHNVFTCACVRACIFHRTVLFFTLSVVQEVLVVSRHVRDRFYTTTGE